MQTTPRKRNEHGLFKEVWRSYNDLIDYCRSIAVMPSGNRGVKVSRTNNGTLLSIDETIPELDEASVVERFQIAVIHDDYLLCQRIEDNAVADIKIAKPYDLRKSTHTGSYTLPTGAASRSVTSNPSVTEYVDPPYLVGDRQIYATKAKHLTGVTIDGEELEYIDLNADARSWKFQKREMVVCIGNDSNWRMIVRASTPYRPQA